MNLAGSTALVTGGSRGIGRAIAIRLARDGADVAVNYRRNLDKAEETVAEIKALGRQSLALQADISEPDEVEIMFAKVLEEIGEIGVLICNAASGKPGDVADLSPEAMILAFRVNTLGTLLCAQSAVPHMKSRGDGRIIAISSPGAHHVFPGYSGVGSSKGGVDSLVRYLAVELAPFNIAVNAVTPGICDTEALHHYLDQGQIDRYVQRTPMRRMVRPEEVASVVAFLCREDASMICGQNISIDGGIFLPF